MKNLGDIQLFLLFLGATICGLIFLFSSIVHYQSAIRKKSLLHLELVTALLLYSDFLSYIFQNEPGRVAYWVIRISNFMLFFLLYVELLGLNLYLRTFVFETKKGGAFRVQLINIFAYAGMAFILLNIFTGSVYFIDGDNIYHRGSLFFVSFIAPLGIYMIILSVVIQYRKIFPKLIFISLIMFAILPVSCAVIQVFFYGLSLMNLSVGFCAIILFGLSLIDQNHFLMHVASREMASGLPNSYGFMIEIKKLSEKGKLTEYNAFHFDIKRMGLINRKYGGPVGSEIIVKYALKIRESMSEDEVLGRLGGNYFVGLIRKENTESFIERLARTELEFPLPGRSEPEIINMSAVAGFYEIEDNFIEPEMVMNNISMAGNIAKNMKHKSYIFLTPELQKEINDIRSIQEQIPRCMAKGEFKPYYQPKVDISDFSLCGAEALVRWEHEGNIINPEQFIPLLEQNENICILDFYMLESVCKDIRQWLDEGKNPPAISVNFSRKNLGNPILAEAIHNVLLKYNIPENLIQVEVTETIDEYPLEYLKDVVLALQKYGISTALDDFGTGSASINLIMEVPFNVLKIDKTFIDSITDKEQKILGHIISISEVVGSDVICEGVETKDQLLILKKLGCTKIQGYYFDKALSKCDFESRIVSTYYEK
ncbi:MAG: EAL domain-containing protein [Treponema sp.]|nr:EAL domain-containing protein [Treponema sp.]